MIVGNILWVNGPFEHLGSCTTNLRFLSCPHMKHYHMHPSNDAGSCAGTLWRNHMGSREIAFVGTALGDLQS